jgi:uncharacterized membrane protein
LDSYGFCYELTFFFSVPLLIIITILIYIKYSEEEKLKEDEKGEELVDE